jgi:hypothetical protein
MTTELKTNKKNKRLYQKPKLNPIKLYVEEVLGVGCKLTSGGFASEAVPCVLNNCSQPGS